MAIISKGEQGLRETLVEMRHQIVHSRRGEDFFQLLVVAAYAVPRSISEAVEFDLVEMKSIVKRRVTIPHQRNLAVVKSLGEIVVFVDVGAIPVQGWLDALIQPLIAGSAMATTGPVLSPQDKVYPEINFGLQEGASVMSAPTCNVAIRKTAFEKVGMFDEHFDYGSDIDFSWRLFRDGIPYRFCPGAEIKMSWGSQLRQFRRAQDYGKARARLFLKHSQLRLFMLRSNPELAIYPAALFSIALAPWNIPVVSPTAIFVLVSIVAAISITRFVMRKGVASIPYNATLAFFFVISLSFFAIKRLLRWNTEDR